MSKKDIKSNNIVAKKDATKTAKVNPVPEKKDHQANIKVKKIPWKLAMRVSFIAGEKIKPKNDEEKAYLKMLEEKKKKYDEKAKALVEAIKARASKIKENANNFADRVIDKMIAEEDRNKRFKASEAKAKEKAKKATDEKIKAKKERKKAKLLALNKTIATDDKLEIAKKRQLELTKESEERLLNNKKEIEAKAKAREARKKLRMKKDIKSGINKVHHHTGEPLTDVDKPYFEGIRKTKKSRKEKKAEKKEMIKSQQAIDHTPAKDTKNKKKAILVNQPVKDVNILTKKTIDKINIENKNSENRLKKIKEKLAKKQIVEIKNKKETESTKGAKPKEAAKKVIINFTVVTLDENKKEVKRNLKPKRLALTYVDKYVQKLVNKFSKKKNFFKLVYNKDHSLEPSEVVFNKAA